MNISNPTPRYQGNPPATDNNTTFLKAMKLIKEGRMLDFIKRCGLFLYARLFLRLLSYFQFVCYKWVLLRKTFSFYGDRYKYFVHRYNTTWKNERTVEIPIIASYLRKHSPGETLEVGNVLSHYFDVSHDIVDKFEKGKNVINEDILTFSSEKKYALIVSISTIEHVGWDDSVQDATKVIRVLEKMNSLKAENGTVVVTAPLGYNPNLDYLLFQEKLPFKKVIYLKRTTSTNKWVEIATMRNNEIKYGDPYPCANAVFIGLI